MLQVFRSASERMAGEKYPTLSYSLVTYVELLDNINDFRHSFQPTGQLAAALNACEAKLKKYFTISSRQSIFYYIALSAYALYLCYQWLLIYLF